MSVVITIDGPAGAGKSTAARMLAKRLGYLFLDTGALYRTVALYLKEKNAIEADDKTIERLLQECEISYDGNNVFLNGRAVSSEIRTPEISELSSVTSTKKVVREFLTDLQRKIASNRDVVAEGRDSGTVVFPQGKKFFLTASIDERARRRWKELKDKGLEVSLEEIKKSIKTRDERDSSRDLAPLKPAEDAIIIDTTGLNPLEVVEEILKKMEQQGVREQ
ncbi:MAG: (d)CMP kinase [Thermodesulfovibrionales bacterium]